MPLTSNPQSPTRDDIIRTLENLRNQTDNRNKYFQPRPYDSFMPDHRVGNYKEQDNSMYGQNLQGIDQQGKNATELSLVLAQNKAALTQQKQAAQKKKFAQQQLSATAQAAASAGMAANTGGSNSYNAITGQWGGAKGFNPKAPIVTTRWRGYNLTMNKSVIPRFTGFLNALAGEGYKIKSIGTYANRNIAGTNIKSLHSLGLAMDINPSDNPVTWNGHNVTNLPPNVGSLAARYGIKWGGSWLHSKRDTMHFSVPYGGRM